MRISESLEDWGGNTGVRPKHALMVLTVSFVPFRFLLFRVSINEKKNPLWLAIDLPPFFSQN